MEQSNVPWHFIFETLAYVTAFRIYVRSRAQSGDFLESSTRWSLIVAAVAGAAIGSRVLFWFEDPLQTINRWSDIPYLLSGKTIIGALLVGTMAVEFVKWRRGIRRRTGDLFALPLAIGIAIGRVGCFLAGKQDDTYGVPTSMPWGIDLGDGVRRHPVQLYEIAAMILLAIALTRIRPPRFAEGDRYRLFVFAYFLWRLLVDFMKPGFRLDGLTTLQWACAAAVLWYAKDIWRIFGDLTVRRKVAVPG